MKKRGNRVPYELHTYVDGNAVRRLEAVPNYHEERLRRKEERRLAEKKRRRRKAARRNRERALKMSAGYVAFLAACVLAAALISAAYVSLQSEATIRQKNIAALETEISDLRIDNDTTYKRINTSVDLKAIKKKARKLGMRYPKKNQIVYYTIDNSDYMTQYSN